MKMKAEHYATLKAAFVEALKNECDRLKPDGLMPANVKDLIAYHAQAYVVQGKTRQMHFDLFWWVNKRQPEVSRMMQEFYKYGDDDHLYTALKAIVKELQES